MEAFDNMKKKKIGCGFDCGGTNLKCYCNIDGKEFTNIIPTGEDFTKRDLINAITNFVVSLPVAVNAIGIAFSGMGTPTHINRTPRKYLLGLDARDFAHLGCKVSFINDANAATLCGLYEYPKAKVLACITNGTGIGSGLCIGGKLFLGASGLAGEITGNILSTVNGPTRAWKLCGGKALQNALAEATTSSEKERILEESATNFGFLLTHVINLINPDVIYLAGGVFKYENYFETVVKTVKEHGVDYMIKDLVIELSTKGTYAGCIGATEYALQ